MFCIIRLVLQCLVPEGRNCHQTHMLAIAISSDLCNNSANK